MVTHGLGQLDQYWPTTAIGANEFLKRHSSKDQEQGGAFAKGYHLLPMLQLMSAIVLLQDDNQNEDLRRSWDSDGAAKARSEGQAYPESPERFNLVLNS